MQYCWDVLVMIGGISGSEVVALIRRRLQKEPDARVLTQQVIREIHETRLHFDDVLRRPDDDGGSN
jgi:hypothetical protein